METKQRNLYKVPAVLAEEVIEEADICVNESNYPVGPDDITNMIGGGEDQDW